MKKTLLTFSIVLLSGVALLAQQITKTSPVKEEEVPVAIRKAFAEDLGAIPMEGNWKVTFSIASEGSRTVAKPLWYTYSKKNEGKKIEVRYSPEGKLEAAKGIEKATDDAASLNKADKSS